MNNMRHIQRQGGQVLVVTTVLFLFISLSLMLTASSSVVRSIRIVRDLNESVRSRVLAESLDEDLVYRIRDGLSFDTEESLTLDGNTATATITSIGSGGLRITTDGNVDNATRRVETELVVGSGASFNFGVQTGEGGFIMENNSTVQGNLFSNGTIQGSGNSVVTGDTISAGPSGLINGIHATGTAYAHTIQNAEIDGDAYYQVIDGATTIGGAAHPGSSDQATSSLPISDEQIGQWEADAEAGSLITTCPYAISDDATIGPVKINCDLDITGNNFTLNVAGTVWVVGDITFSNSSVIKVDPSLGNKSVAFIADNSANNLTSGRIFIQNAPTFENSGTEGSYILLLSANESAEQGGLEPAIDAAQNADGDVLFYANHGEVRLQNSVSLREVTAWRVRLQNYAKVIYETGLVSTLFTSGPGGGYVINKWDEIE